MGELETASICAHNRLVQHLREDHDVDPDLWVSKLTGWDQDGHVGPIPLTAFGYLRGWHDCLHGVAGTTVEHEVLSYKSLRH